MAERGLERPVPQAIRRTAASVAGPSMSARTAAASSKGCSVGNAGVLVGAGRVLCQHRGDASRGVGRVEGAVEFRTERGGGLGIERRHRGDVRLVRLARDLQLVQCTGGLAAANELGPGGQPILAGLEDRRRTRG